MLPIFLPAALVAAALLAPPAAAQVAPFPICADPAGPALPAGYQISERTLTVDGTQRWYCLVTPPGFSAGGPDHPAVFVFHGGNGNPQNLMANGRRILEEGLARGYVLVFPAGLGDAARCDPAVPCEHNFWNDASNLDFLQALLAEAATFNLDETRVYLAGFSGGALLIHRAIEAGSFAVPVAAIATAARSIGALAVADPASGFPVVNVAAGTPVHALLFQGEADTRLAFDGGLSDNDTEVQLPFSVKVDLFRVLTGNASTPGTPQAMGAAAATLYDVGSHDVLAVSEPSVGHIWPGALSPTVFDFFDTH